MSQTIQGVPESITREQYVTLIRSTGIEVENLYDLRFSVDGIYATVKALDENGSAIVDKKTHELVKNVIYIPVKA